MRPEWSGCAIVFGAGEAAMVEFVRSITILAMGSVVVSAGVFVVVYG
ncbi:MAG: hypothetical protein ACK4MF_04345 [Hyphomicrobiaceae bacterium]